MSADQVLGTGEIRLLELFPGNSTWGAEGRICDPLAVRFRSFRLGTPNIPFYEILSSNLVGGGDGEPTSILDCSGHRLEVTQHTITALQAVRFPDKPRLLWVASLCLDKTDEDGSVDRTALTGKIYEEASRTLVVLDDDDPSGLADTIVRYVFDENARIKDSVHFQFLGKFLENQPWFSNVWSLQDLALSKHILFVCYGCCFSLGLLLSFWQRSSVFAGPAEPLPTVTYGFHYVYRTSLLQQLHSTRKSNALSARDKLSALFSMFPLEKDELMPHLHSASSDHQVYREFVANLASKTRSLQVLSMVQGTQNSEASWVPGWNSDYRTKPLGLLNAMQEPYDAGGWPAVGLSFKESNLTCLGVKFDTVDKLGESCPFSYEPALSTLNEWNKLVSEAITQDPATESEGRPTEADAYPGRQLLKSKPASDAFWPTVTAKPPPAIHQQLGSYLAVLGCGTPGSFKDLAYSFGRRLLITRAGLLGLAPADTKAGDIVCILLGAPVPHVLRPMEDGTYMLVGECYVHGVMDGEALAHLHEELSAQGHRSRLHATSKSAAPLEQFVIS